MWRSASCACLLIASAAHAQTSPGKLSRPPLFVAQNIRSEAMGRCALRHDRRHALTIAASTSGSADEHAAVAAFMPALTKCLAGARSATLDPSYLRGGIAEALLEENDGALLTKAAGVTPMSPSRVDLTGAKEPNVTLLGCAVAAQPADAAAMIASAAASPEEASAFRKLAPSLQACAPVSGKVLINPARVRPATAIALYRLVATR